MEKTEETYANHHSLLADAEDATNQDHEMTLSQAVKLYHSAIGWSIVMSTALVMDGFDTKLMASLFAQPAFAERYGKLQPNGKFQIPAPWQSGLNNGSNVGQLIGLSISGWLTERVGFRRTMMLGLLIVPCLIFIQFFAPSLGVLETGQVLLGRGLLLVPLTSKANGSPKAFLWGFFRQQLVFMPSRSCKPALLDCLFHDKGFHVLTLDQAWRELTSLSTLRPTCLRAYLVSVLSLETYVIQPGVLLKDGTPLESLLCCYTLCT